jgi:hypothetical protein
MTDFDPTTALEDLGIPVPEPIDQLKPNAIQSNHDFVPGTVGWTVSSEDGGRAVLDLKGETIVNGELIFEQTLRGINPKDALGAAKVDPSVVPPSAELHLATAMMDGAVKYGPFNWRDNPVQARVYYAAARRHLSQWLDGEHFDPVSNVHHLGHAMACCAIILDAYENGNLDDNRPRSGPAGEMIRSFDTKRRWVDRIRRFFNR